MSHTSIECSLIARRGWLARVRLLLFALLLGIGVDPSIPGWPGSPAATDLATAPGIDVPAGTETSAILPSEMRHEAATDRRMARGQTEQMPGSAGSGSAAGPLVLALLAGVPVEAPHRRAAAVRPLPAALPPGPGSPARLPFPTGPPALT